MNRAELVDLVVQAVRERVAATGAEVLPETRLGQNGLGLDSIAILELVLELEQRSGITLRDESLSAADLETPASLAAYVASIAGG